jgi:Helix-turn-helix domain
MGAVRDQRAADWFWMNKGLLEHYGAKIGVHGIAVYAVLAKCANGEGQATPSLRYIAKLLGIGTSTVQRYIDKLIEHKLIDRQRRMSEYGDYTSTEYILLTIKAVKKMGVSTAGTPVSTAGTGVSTAGTGVSTVSRRVYPQPVHGVSTVSTEQDPSNKTDLNKTLSPPTPSRGKERESVSEVRAIQHFEASYTPPVPYTLGFLRLREVYPAGRLEGEHEAFQTWQGRDLEPRSAEIVDKVARLVVTTWLTRERRYIPLLKTWLDKGRYDDPLVPLEVAPEPGPPQDYLTARKAREDGVAQRFLEKYHARSRGPAGLSGGDETLSYDVQYRADR